MRKDEKYMLDIIKSNLINEFSFEVVQGDEPPDYYLKFEHQLIALELTQLHPSVIVDGHVIEARSYSEPITRYLNTLDKELGELVSEGYYINLQIKFPIDNFKKFKMKLRQELHDLINCDFRGATEGLLKIEDEHVKWILFRNNSLKKIAGSIQSKSNAHVIGIDRHLNMVITKIINTKQEKMKRVVSVEVTERWLGILNTYFLSDFSNIENAMKMININDTFEKILFLDLNGQMRSFDCVERFWS